MPHRALVAVTILTEPGSLARVDMRAAKKKTENRKVLQELVPLNALSSERFDALAEKIVIEDVRSGRYLFRKGDRDGQTIYLLAGKVNLMDGFRKVSGEVEAGTEASRHPIAAQQPRPFSAKVASKAVIARIDSSLLEAFLSWDHSSAAEVVDIEADDDGDWMTRLLQSETFSKLSPSKLQGLLMKMKPITVRKGEVVIAEGSEGDYFYTIHEGRCAVTRQGEAGGKPQLLAELADGDSFGEDALVSNKCRNATVTMLTDGELMRLAKQDFIDLLKTQLVRNVTLEQAEQLASEGAVWADVRSREEYEHGSIADSVNIPLDTLREETHELVYNTSYIICCDTGSRSESAAFMLSHKGFDVYVLEGGMQNLPLAEAAPGTGRVAEVVDLAAAAALADPPAASTAEAAAAEQAARLQADYDALRSRHDALLVEQEQQRAAEAHLEEQLEQLRGELGGSAGRLDELHAQANAHAGDKQSLLEQYEVLQKEHANQLQSMQLELEQERSKAQELASQVDVTAGECATLKEKAAADEQDAQAELTRLQAGLEKARGRVIELESVLESSDAAQSTLQEQSDVSSEQRRKELQALRNELDAARNDAERLSTDLAAVTGERQALINEIETLNGEMVALQQAATVNSGKLVEEGEVAETLSAQNDELSRQVEQLRVELAERKSQLDSSTADLENRAQELQQQLEHQLADGEQQQNNLQSLHDELDAAHSNAERLSTDLAVVTGERQALVNEIEKLNGEMAVLQQAAAATTGKLVEEGEAGAALRAQSDELRRQVEQLRSQLAERQSQLDSDTAVHETRTQELQQQLEQLQGELAERESQLESSAAESETRTQELQQQLEQLQGELTERESQLESSAAESETRTQELQQQLDQQLDELQQVQEQLQGATAEHEQAQSTIGTLQEENRQLSISGSEVNNEYQAQLERAEGLLEERNAAAAVYARQQKEWDEQRSALQKQAATEQEVAGKLHDELEQLTVAMAEASAVAEQKQQQIEEAGAVLEQQEQRFSELEQSASATADELELLKQQRDELQQQVEQSASDNTGLEQEVSALDEQLVALAGSTEEQIAGLQAQLEAGQQQFSRAEQEISDKDAQIETARLELSQHEVDKTVLGQELELSRQQAQELQQALEQYETQVKSLEQELQESSRKAHDDLKRKNDIEKELQGQIEQQRKKLEQVTADYQKARKEAQDNIDYLRDELHAERDARDVERVEMATLQRELKEQLTIVASGQEGNTGDSSGVIEEAVDAARAEERGRLQGVLEAHAATEEQLTRVQAELQQAHAELAEHHREEKNRRQGDVELMEEQNRQAEAAIAQQQDQLQKLTEERDGALEEQQELREKMDALRAEVEVARGLMSGPGQGKLEDPVQLRKQLDDTRQNVEIAVRLRTEAETARDRLLEERDKLLVQLENSQNVGAPAPNSEPPAGGSRQTQTASDAAGPGQAATQETVQPESASKKVPGGVSRLPRWLGPAISLLAVGIIAMAVWFLIPVEFLVENEASIDIAENVADVDAEGMPPVAAELSETEAVQEPTAEHAQPAPIVREKPVKQASKPAPVKKKKVAQAPAKEKKAAPAPETAAPTKTSPVVRTFNDRLKIGGRGPAMVALAAASYQMGSPGNSINFTEVPQHEVKLSAFSISRHEVTFDEYGRYARSTGKRLPKDEGWGRGKQPVINVSWSDARGYVEWLSAQTGKTYRLPTEAEWEYAARGGNENNFWWVGVHKNIPANCFDCGSNWDGARTAPVGQFAANNYGLHDMAGNVQEWTADCYNKNYTGAPADGSAWLTPECTAHVVRGGAYSSPQDSLRSAKRVQLDQDTRLDNVGFRVVRVD